MPLSDPLPDRPGFTERRSSTVLKLVQAARALIAEGDIDSATVDDVIERAGVSKRSFYNHFADRDALTRQVTDDACQALQDHLLQLASGVQDPAARLLRLAVGCMSYCSADPCREQVLTRSVHAARGQDTACLAPLFEAFAAAVRAKAVAPVSCDAGGALLVATCLMGSSHLQRLGSDTAKARALAHQMALLLLRGLRADHRRQAALARQAVELAWPVVPTVRAA